MRKVLLLGQQTEYKLYPPVCTEAVSKPPEATGQQETLGSGTQLRSQLSQCVAAYWAVFSSAASLTGVEEYTELAKTATDNFSASTSSLVAKATSRHGSTDLHNSLAPYLIFCPLPF